MNVNKITFSTFAYCCRCYFLFKALVIAKSLQDERLELIWVVALDRWIFSILTVLASSFQSIAVMLTDRPIIQWLTCVALKKVSMSWRLIHLGVFTNIFLCLYWILINCILITWRPTNIWIVCEIFLVI